MITTEERSKHSERLIYLADKMEQACDDPQFLKELNREYKIIAKILYPPKERNNNLGYSSAKIKESRQKALEQIKAYLDLDDIEEQFNNRGGDYYSNDKFIISYFCNHNGIASEITLDKTDSFFTNSKCIKAKRNLFYEKQMKAYGSFERALVEEGLNLCATKEIRTEFFNKYAVAYNERLKQKRNERD